MAIQNINIGTSANSGNGDPLRTAFTKINQNFSELYVGVYNRPVFSGSYNDLTNKPALFDGNYNSLSNKPELFDGNYNSLSNKPTIPADVSDLTDTQSLLGGGGGNGNQLVSDENNNTFTITNDGNVVFSGETGGVNRGLVWDYGVEAGGVNSEVRQDMDGLTVRAYTDSVEGDIYSAPVRIVTNQGENEKLWQFNGIGNLILPSGGIIGETLVTDNPTVVIQPAEPEHETQALFIKGGGPVFTNTENGITVLVFNTLTYANNDVVNMAVETDGRPGLQEGDTLYWWVDQYSPGQEFQPDNGTLIINQFNAANFDFTVLDSSVPFRVYVADTLYNAYANNLGAVSVDINTAFVDTSLHLHLTTGDLTETSIFLGTDDHNIRTKPNGAIELTSYDYDNDQTYRLNFKNNTLRISSTDNPNDEDLYIKAEDDLYLDALSDDIHIRASDDIRLRAGYDFADDDYAWQYLFTDSGNISIYNSNEGYDYGYIRSVLDQEDNDRGISIESPGSTYIKSDDSNYTWKFERSGNLIFPDGTSQTTAWMPTRSVPTISLGEVGDRQGDVALDENYMYYCTSDYVGTPVTLFWTNVTEVTIGGEHYIQADVTNPNNLTGIFSITNISVDGSPLITVTVTRFELVSGNTYKFFLENAEPWQSFQNSQLQIVPNIWKRIEWSNDTW